MMKRLGVAHRRIGATVHRDAHQPRPSNKWGSGYRRELLVLPHLTIKPVPASEGRLEACIATHATRSATAVLCVYKQLGNERGP